MKNKQLNADLTLLLVAVIWGSGFIATEYALNADMSPLLIMAMRFTIAALILFAATFKELKSITKSEWIKGSIAGIFLFMGFFLQSFGQSMTTVSNSAFITATNVIMVPFVVWIFTKKKPALKIVLLAFMTFIGVAILTVSPSQGLHLNMGDLLILLCAVAFACHITYVEIAVSGSDPKKIAFIQISVAAVLSIIGLGAFDMQSISHANFAIGLPSVIFLGVFSTCLCFFLQTSAQKRTSASKAGIIMSTEGFFGTLFSILLGLEPLTAKILIGGTMIITAVILTEVKFDKLKHKSII